MPDHFGPRTAGALVDAICDRFSRLDRAALERYRGGRAGLVALVAEAHDLTRAEAAEQLDWIVAHAPRPGLKPHAA